MRAGQAHNLLVIPMRTLRKLILGLFLVALSVATVAAVAAQETLVLPGDRLAQQSLRAYWHVFIAYAIAIGLVLGWVVSIARRLSRIEAQLND